MKLLRKISRLIALPHIKTLDERVTIFALWQKVYCLRIFLISFVCTALLSNESIAAQSGAGLLNSVKSVVETIYEQASNPFKKMTGTIPNFTSTKGGVMLRDDQWQSMPGFLKTGCSGGIVNFPIVNANEGTRTLFTAGHCIQSWSEGHHLDALVGARSSNYLFDFYKSEQKIKIETSKGGFRYDSDIAYFSIPISADVKGVTLELAAQPPLKGETIYILGYPGGNGPQEIPCVVDGQTISIIRENRQTIFTLAYRATCPYVGFLPGASGSPILNNQKEFAGVLSSSLNSKNRTVIFFYGTSARDLTSEMKFPSSYMRGETGSITIPDAVDPISGETFNMTVDLNEGRLVRIDSQNKKNNTRDVINFQNGILSGPHDEYRDGRLFKRTIYTSGRPQN